MTTPIPFSTALRERSSGAHSGSESAGFMADLLKGEGTREDYVALVAQHWFIYDALEAAAELPEALLAPSTVAASYRSLGMPCRPASRLTMKKG